LKLSETWSNHYINFFQGVARARLGSGPGIFYFLFYFLIALALSHNGSLPLCTHVHAYVHTNRKTVFSVELLLKFFSENIFFVANTFLALRIYNATNFCFHTNGIPTLHTYVFEYAVRPQGFQWRSALDF
jgi:hypothetical protein